MFLFWHGSSSSDQLISISVNKQIPVFECLIEPDMVVNIKSSVTGIYETINVDISDRVKRGQILAKLKSDVQKSVVSIAKARASRKDEIHLRETELALTKRKLTRIIELHDKKSVSPSEKDEAQTAVVLAEFELQKATNNNELAKLEYKKAKHALARRTIKSPINGIIVSRNISPGESTDDKSIFTIAKVSPLKVELIIPVEYFGLITLKMKALITPEIFSSKRHIATVSIVDKVIDAASGTFGVRLTLPNPGQQLPGGLKCQAKFMEVSIKPIQ